MAPPPASARGREGEAVPCDAPETPQPRRSPAQPHPAATQLRQVYLAPVPVPYRAPVPPKCVVGYRILGERAFASEDEGRGDLRDSDDKDALILETWASGRLTVRFLLDSGDTHDISVDLAPGGVVRIDKADLPPAQPRRKITVLLPDGSPPDTLWCYVYPQASWLRVRDDKTGLAGAHFRITGALPEDGFCATRRGRLEGAGPWTVRLGSAALRVTLTLEDGERKDRALYVDGEIFKIEPGATTAVTGLLPGPHTILVGAEGHLGRAMRVVLEEGETREIRVRLPRR